MFSSNDSLFAINVYSYMNSTIWYVAIRTNLKYLTIYRYRQLKVSKTDQQKWEELPLFKHGFFFFIIM